MNFTLFMNVPVESSVYLTTNIFLFIFLYYVIVVEENQEIPVVEPTTPQLAQEKIIPKIKYPLKAFHKSEDYASMKDRVKHNYIMEYCDHYGNIIMLYDFSSQSFQYYADKSNIPFQELETCARKFVNTYQCTELYIITPIVEISSNSITDVPMEKECKKRALFANLKKKIKPTIHIPETTEYLSFVYRGKVSNFQILQKVSPQKMSYTEFKQKYCHS